MLASHLCAPLQAFRPALQAACTQHPDALFLTVAVQPDEVAAAASPASLVPAATVPGPSPCSTAERVELLQGLSIAALPCTLLMRGGQLLARLEMDGSAACSGHGSSTAAGAAAAAAAAEAAAVRLYAALEAVQPRTAGTAQ